MSIVVLFTHVRVHLLEKSALKIIPVLSLRRTEERPNVCDSVASFNLCVENVETLTKNNDRSRDFRFQI